ncbi:hypothetical protein M9H77_12725 [Catharanthus roseus]|uniref:Uncharacterized protein n=1 Tax=Catharanthus roseus TaxID=4058 RepID=A0ACC0BI74_CATRO|nr:hypothetical protein M9H77_12725 [Catharanthus roseus]
MEQKVGDNLGGYNSSHHQRSFDNVSTSRYHDMLVQNSYTFHEGGYQGRPQVRGGRRGGLGIKGTIDHKKSFQDMKHGVKIICMKIMKIIRIVVFKPQASTYKSWPNKEDIPKVAFKDDYKLKVEKKRRLITNPTRCFMCNSVGHIAINCPTKRTLVVSRDLNGWIDEDFREGIVDKDENREDQEIASFEADEDEKIRQQKKDSSRKKTAGAEKFLQQKFQEILEEVEIPQLK